MPAAPLPLDEEERLRVLRAYDALDATGEQTLDDIVTIAAEVCGTPMAAVTLIDQHRQWFAARKGLDDPETARDDAFCSYTILDTAPLIVPDARADARFADNRYVLESPHIQFYAGAPLITPSGHELGALCVIDLHPRNLTAGQVTVLEALARQVVALFELRRTSRQLAGALERVRLLAQLLPLCAWCRKMRNDKDYWVNVETYISTQTGSMVTHGICPDCAANEFDPQGT